MGELIQRLRAGKGLTQRQLAEEAGVPLTSLRNWEVDHREPGLRAAVRLAAALGTTAEALAGTVEAPEGSRPRRAAGPTRKRGA